jgi:hypothetical protein
VKIQIWVAERRDPRADFYARIKYNFGGETTSGFPRPPASGCAGDLEALPIQQKRALCVTLTHYARHVSATPSQRFAASRPSKSKNSFGPATQNSIWKLNSEGGVSTVRACVDQFPYFHPLPEGEGGVRSFLSRNSTTTLHGLSTHMYWFSFE